MERRKNLDRMRLSNQKGKSLNKQRTRQTAYESTINTTDSPRSKRIHKSKMRNSNIKFILLILGILLVVILVFFAISGFINNNNGIIQEINTKIENLATGMILWLVISWVVWALVISAIGKNMEGMPKLIVFFIVAGLILLCKVFPSLGIIIIIFSVIIFLFGKIIG